ncbi:MAG: sensor histidine kinase [Bilifractor sp.]
MLQQPEGTEDIDGKKGIPEESEHSGSSVFRKHRKHRDKKNGKKLRKLQSKLFSYMMLPPILVLAFFSLFFLQYNSRILISREQNVLETLNSTLMNATEKQLNDLDKFSSNLNFYNRKTDLLPDVMDFNVNSEQGRAFLDYVQTMNGLDPKANQINLYDFYGNVIESGMITKNAAYQTEDVPWMDQVKVLRGKKLISTPYRTGKYSQGSVSSNWYLSLYRATLNRQNQIIGAIETVKSCKVIFRSIASYESKSSSQASIFVFASDGTRIYPYEDITDKQKETYQNYYKTQEASDASYGIGTDPETGIKYQYSRQTSPYSGWTYMVLQKNSVILRPVYHMTQILLSVTGLMVLFSILLSLYLSHNMVKPIKHLKHVVQRLRLENLGEEKLDQYDASYDELDELYKEFQKMSESLQQSLAELEISQKLELKSRVIALQVQMNPHFYYNTLSCISILAENGQNEDVTKLCQTLSQIMRYITNTGTTIVSVSDEIHYIREYMYCMKVRYQESLDYSIDILPEIMEEKIPKLILQPLVENSIKYGTDCLPPWKITVTSYRDDEMWYITVTDTGNGFSEKVLDELNTKIADVNRDPRHKLTDLKIGGLGMINVYIRWKLYCGEDILFDYGNTEDGHAYVMIGRKTPDTTSEDAEKSKEMKSAIPGTQSMNDANNP